MGYVVCGILSESRVYVGVFHKGAYKSFSMRGLGFSTILCSFSVHIHGYIWS